MVQLLIACLLFFTSCSSNGPKYTVDDSMLENVPAHEKLNVAQAKKAIETAEQASVTADSSLEVAEKNLSEAEKGRDTAKHQLKVATLSLQTAETGYTLAKQRLKLAKLNKENSKKEVFAALNQQELEKAKVVEQRGIKAGKDFSVRNFETATLEAKKESTDSQLEANKLAKEIDELAKKYEQQTQDYLEARK